MAARSNPPRSGTGTRRARWSAVAAGLVVTTLLTSGCTGISSDPGGGTSSGGPTGTPAASASAAPSASSTLTAAQQQAFEEATAVVLAYRQTITDLYSGARTDLNDLDEVATGALLDSGLRNISQGLAMGARREPAGVRVRLATAQPLKFTPAGQPNVVVIAACIDATAVTIVDAEGMEHRGVRELADYTVVQTEYLPDPGWAVSQIRGKRAAEDRRC